MEKQYNTEQRVAETILQRPTEIVTKIGTFKVAQPTPATLMLVSEQVAQMPHIDRENPDILGVVLATARGAALPMGKIAAILILGARRVLEGRKVRPHGRNWLRRLFSRRVYEVDALALRLITECTPSEISAILMRLLASQNVGDFFGVTASLSGANVLKPTREAGE